MSPRRNEVAIIARLAPSTLSFLQVPLTPARAARLADFCARAGIDAQALVLDLLDDVIFNIAGSVVSGGAASCTETYLSESPAREKSPDKNAESHAKLRFEISPASPSSYGQTKQPPPLQASSTPARAPLSDGCQARSNHLSASSTSPCSKSSGGAND